MFRYLINGQRELPDWKNLDDWKWCSRFAYQVISKRGVDGAAFRWMYRDFLNEISVFLPFIEESGLSGLMDEAGKCWNELSMLLKQISETDLKTDEFSRASDIAERIFNIESKFYRRQLNLQSFDKVLGINL